MPYQMTMRFTAETHEQLEKIREEVVESLQDAEDSGVLDFDFSQQTIFDGEV